MRNGAAGAWVLGAIVLPALAPAGASAQAVQGRLLDMEAGAPIVLARMTLVDADDRPVALGVTDDHGRFLLAAHQPGRYWVHIESPFHESYADGPFALAQDDTVTLTFELAPLPVELQELTVEAERRSPRLTLEGVYDRSEAGIGVHFDSDRIEARQEGTVSELVALLPMVELYADPTVMATRVVFRQRQFERLLEGDGTRAPPCFPQVFLNGARLAVGGTVPGGLDQFSLNDLEAVEVYESPSSLPGRFSGPNSHCGTIVLWTR